MRRSRTTFAFLALLLSCIVPILPSCGGSSAGKVVSITVTPSPVSVAYGQVLQLTATAVNNNNGIVSTGFTFASSNTSAVSIAPSGALCGGTWDANFVTCSKPASLVSATATITVTAQVVTATVQAYVHEKVDSVAITSYPGIGLTGPICATSTQCTCTSLSLANSTSLPQFQATAYSNDPTVCAPKSLSVPCDITADLTATPAGGTVDRSSPFQWSSSDTTIATIATAGTSISSSGTVTSTSGILPAGTVTPIGTGQASISASTAGVNSPSVPFATCPVTSVTLTATNAANSGLGPITISPGSTQALSAAVTDTTGATITYPTLSSTSLALNYPALSWLSTDFYTVTTATQTQSVKTTLNGVSTTETVPLSTAIAAGETNGIASLVASCTPPSCNKNLFPVYSNPIDTTNFGSTTATAFIASSQSQTMVSLNLTTGGLLYSYTLPSAPNSFLFNKQGTKAVLGSNYGVFVFDPVAVTFTTFQFNGTVLAISPDGSTAALFGQLAGGNQNSIGIINLTQNSLVATFPVAGTATAADFSLDSRYLWVPVTPTGGTTSRIYVFTSGVGSTFFTTSSPVNDLAFLANGPLVYLAGDTSAASITARATCFGGQQTASTVVKPSTGVVDVQPGVAPLNIRALPSGAGILALDPPNINVVTLTNPQTPFVGCPPSLPSNVSGPIESVSPQNLALSSLAPPPAGNGLNQFLVTPDSNTAVLTDTSTSSTGSSVIMVSLSPLQSLVPTTIPLANNANLKDQTTGLVFKGDFPADSSGFVVGGNDMYLHEIVVGSGTDNAFPLSGVGLLQADGVTNALPNLVAIRNQ
jgi:hypothetical protein